MTSPAGAPQRSRTTLPSLFSTRATACRCSPSISTMQPIFVPGSATSRSSFPQEIFARSWYCGLEAAADEVGHDRRRDQRLRRLEVDLHLVGVDVREPHRVGRRNARDVQRALERHALGQLHVLGARRLAEREPADLPFLAVLQVRLDRPRVVAVRGAARGDERGRPEDEHRARRAAAVGRPCAGPYGRRDGGESVVPRRLSSSSSRSRGSDRRPASARPAARRA